MKRKELEKVADSVRVDCFVLNLTKFKYSADELLSDFLEKMMGSLRDSLGKEVEEIQVFLEDALDKLSRKSSSIEETQKNKALYL